MRRLPSVNQLVAEATEHVKIAQEQEKTASTTLPVYTAPIAAELQKVAAACREGAVITLEDVTEFARRIQGGLNA